MLKPIRRTRWLRPWWGLIAVAILLVAGLAVDTVMKVSPLEGYCPDDATCIAASSDFLAFYAGVAQSAAFRKTSEEFAERFADAELAARNATGIRPTAFRCWLWLGNRLLAAKAPEGVGVCIRPGLLLRSVDTFRRVILRAAPEDGVYAYGKLHYAWREGFLIVSESKGYVVSSLSAPVPELEPSDGRDDLRILFTGEHRASIHLHGREGLPVSGWCEANVSHRDSPLTVTDVWPDSPVLSIAASRCADVAALAGFAWGAVPKPSASEGLGFCLQALASMAGRMATAWRVNVLSKDWDKASSECACALLDVNMQGALPAPSLALVLRGRDTAAGPHPLQPLVPADTAVAYEWNGHSGTLVPWAGEPFTLCLSRSGQDWLATSQEPAMARLAGALHPGTEIRADLALRVQWKRLAGIIETLARKAGSSELVPRMDEHDVEKRVLPFLHVMEQLGALELDATMDQGKMTFRGSLANAGAR